MADGYWQKRYLRGNALVVALALLVFALRTTASEPIAGSLDWPRQWIVFGPLLVGD